MQEITLREANQHLSHYIDIVEKGEEIIITRRGKPVAKLLSIPQKCLLNEEQKKVLKHLCNEMKKGYPLGIKKFDRESAYER